MKRWVFVVVVLLLVTTCTARPGDRTLYPSRYGQVPVSIFLIDNGWHTDIALPAGPLGKTGGQTAAAAREVTPNGWVLVGWGDAVFYKGHGLTGARVLDGFRAALKPGNPAVVRLTGIGQAPDILYDGRAVELQLSQESFNLMVGRIDRSLGARAERVAGPDKADIAYFASTERFSILHLCNHWTAEVLNAGGIGVTPVLDTTTMGLKFDLWLRRIMIDETLDTNRLRS